MIGAVATFAALLAALVLFYAVHVAHDVARRHFADRADAREKRATVDAAEIDALRDEVRETKKLAAEHHRVLAALATKGARR